RRRSAPARKESDTRVCAQAEEKWELRSSEIGLRVWCQTGMLLGFLQSRNVPGLRAVIRLAKQMERQASLGPCVRPDDEAERYSTPQIGPLQSQLEMPPACTRAAMAS